MNTPNENAGHATIGDMLPAVLFKWVTTLICKTKLSPKYFKVLLIAVVLTFAVLWWKYPFLIKVVALAPLRERTAEVVFPPDGSHVPRTVTFKAHKRNIGPREDIRVEVRNEDGKCWYKHLLAQAGDGLIRTNHHYGLIEMDVGKKFISQVVVVPAGLNLNEDMYDGPQPVERLGKPVTYTRRECTPGETLTPETWRTQMIAKAEID